ncbi:MAG: glycosyltransferase family 1 protein, partial [Planctomycetes bacterium]|nr:glycosyltransferase family 1 protein [Planctomycetota bacterium]
LAQSAGVLALLLPADAAKQKNFIANIEALSQGSVSLVKRIEELDPLIQQFANASQDERLSYMQHALPDTMEEASNWRPQGADGATLLLGIGSGARVQTLLEESKFPVVVADVRPMALYFAFQLADWSGAILKRRLQFIVPEIQTPLDGFKNLVNHFGQLAIVQGLRVFGGAEFWERAIEDEVWAVEIDRGMIAAYQAIFGKEKESSLRPSLLRFHNASLERGRITSERKLNFAASIVNDTTALESILRCYQRGLEAIGHSMTISYETYEHSLSDRIQNIIREVPDVFLSVVHFGLSAVGAYDSAFSLPKLTLLNNAHFHLKPFVGAIDLSTRRDHYVFAPDQEQLDFVQTGFHVEGEVLELATSYEDFELPPEKEIAPLIRFIGSIPDPDGKVLQLRKGPHWNAIVERFWGFVDERFMGDMDEFERSVRDLTGFNDGEIMPLHLWSGVSRISGLEALAGLPLEIYGAANWVELIAGTPLEGNYCRHLEPRQELPATMSRALININFCVLGNTSAANMRTYDATGLGTCVIQDRKPEAVKNFVADQEMVFFESPQDLRAKAEALLADPARAREIGRAARNRVLAEHTFNHRAQRLVDVVYQRYDGAQTGIHDPWIMTLFPQE